MKLKTIMAATLITATMATTAPMAATPAAAATTTASTTAATTTATKTWKDTKYSKPLVRYTSKANVKVRSGATSTSKVVKTYKKGTKLTVVGKTNTGYFKLNNGYYVLITSVTKTKPGTTTTNKTTTNTQYPEDKYGPGENGYPKLGTFVENCGDGWGYVFVDCEMTLESLPEMNEGYCFTKKKLTAVGGKDIPYGWYCIVGDLADGNYERIQYPAEIRPTIDIYGTNGKLREYGIYTKGEIFYLGKGEKIIARNLVMAPAKNGTITYRGVDGGSYSRPYNTELQQSSLVTAKGTGYGIEAGKYKVVVDPDTERFDNLCDGAWVYKVGDYANIETVTYRQLDDSTWRKNTRNIVSTGKFLYSDSSLAPDADPDDLMKFRWDFDKNGTPYDGIHKDMLKSNKQPVSLTPKTITLNAGDLVICRGATLVKVG